MYYKILKIEKDLGKIAVSEFFFQICSVLRRSLDTCFPASRDIRIISEAGAYFVGSAFTLAVNVIAKRIQMPRTTGKKKLS